MSQTPTIGRIVQYKLADYDLDNIVAARMSDDGARGNVVHEGDIYPAIIVRIFGIQSNDGTVVALEGVNLQVFLDGNHCHWATSRVQGDQPGQWAWPERV